jgi:uncharacterized protein
MNVRSILLLAVLLLSLYGCSEKAAVNKTKTAALSVSTIAASAVPTVAISTVPSGYDWSQFTPTTEQIAKWQKEAESGNADSQYQIGHAYSLGKGVPEDAAKAFEWYQKAATQGNAKAQLFLGDMYTKGEGVPKNDAKAVGWFQKAATQGDAYAQINLGKMYAKGKGVSKNLVKMTEWFQKAAAQGTADVQVILGTIYEAGVEGVPKNTTKAAELYQKAAMQGDADAQNLLGYMYLIGEGVQKDNTKSAEWYQKAAGQGDLGAQSALCSLYAVGAGVPKDMAQAAHWCLKAAVQGDAKAQSALGLMYAKGDGVDQNIVLAYAWSNLAAAQGFDNAETILNSIEVHLTSAQRAEGQRLASNWKKGDILLASSSGESALASPDGKPSKQSTGTAFAVSISGHALTNHHVVDGCTEVRIAGREGIAKVITSDNVNDLALLQLPGNTKDIASLNPDLGKLRQGEDIIVFGYPLNSVLSSGGNLTPGTISALTGLGNNTNQIQITAPIQPGSSGSPVMDKKGNVVGVVSMKLDDAKMAKATGQIGQNINFAVNGLTVKAFLDANKVPYKTGGGFFSREKSNADIAEEARKWTVLVECWK